MIYIAFKCNKYGRFLAFCVLCCCSAISFARQKGHVGDFISGTSQLEINGEIGQRLMASYQHRILAQDVDRLIAVFRKENRTEDHMWQSEFWGKWFTSAVQAYEYRPSEALKKVIDKAAKDLMATQTEDGYIGNYAPDHLLEQWDIWGRKYCLLGLIAYYDLTGDKKSLQAASRAADNLMSDLKKTDGIIVTKGNYRGMAASSILEPICLLYARTANKKYLDFAEQIASQWETATGPQLISKASIDVGKRFPKPKYWYSWEQGQKAYEMMSCYEGLLELYRLTGRTEYKRAVEDTWQNILDTEINLAGSGAAAEMWFGGKALQTNMIAHYQETCVTVTWIKLSLQLFRLTGEAKYADAVENAYYNALLGSMTADGATWTKYTPLKGQRLPGSEQCGMGLNCCEASGPRGLFAVPPYVSTASQDGLSVNLFMDGVYQLKSPIGQEVLLTQKTSYPLSGQIAIRVGLKKEEDMTLSVRIPSWSKDSKVKLNGDLLNELPSQGYVKIKRKWKSGDEITVQLDMSARLEERGGAEKQLALFRGPILLARDSRLIGPPVGVALAPVHLAEGTIQIEPVETNTDGIWLKFKAKFLPESYTETGAEPVEVELCDYASAGHAPGLPFYSVWFSQLIEPQQLNQNF
ncbi:glycoside hydrolase family 127 protein [Olivibacter sitiensis]|uniref:glycoside hydrolase family 127 protein n=1 Tax=Olivibacter sitiensis TaxID=376470 RepID=UPI000A009C16|nr:beta-L-arabinofuranosidase domain-containing protein [Olivibacter sitiensis]